MKKFIAIFVIGTIMIIVIVLAFFVLFGKIKPKSQIFGPIIPSTDSDGTTADPCSGFYNVGENPELSELYDTSPVDLYRTNSDEFPGYGVWFSQELNTGFIFPDDAEVVEFSPTMKSLNVTYYYEDNLSSFVILPGRLKKPCDLTFTSTMSDKEINESVGTYAEDTYAKQFATKLFDENTKTKISSVKLKNANQNIRKEGLTHTARIFEITDDRGMKYEYISMYTVKKGITVVSIYFGNSGHTVEDLINMIVFGD